MKIGITGANGHIGNNICRVLLSKNYEVNVLIKNSVASLEKLNVTKFSGDITQPETLNDFFKNSDLIIHTAADIALNKGNPDQTIAINIGGTKNIIEKCFEFNIKKLIHFSSIHAFDPYPIDDVLDESRPLVKNCPFIYDKSKAEAETMVWEAMKKGLQAVILSPTGVVGPDDYKPSAQGKSLLNLYHGKAPALISGGYDFVDVRDVAFAAVSAIENGRSGEKYLLSGSWVDIKKMSELVSMVPGARCPKIVVPHGLVKFFYPIAKYFISKDLQLIFNEQTLEILETGSKKISAAKAEKELGYTRRSIEDTVGDTMKWFSENNFIKK